MPAEAVVVGAGAAGLAAAEQIARGGIAVAVLDRLPAVGGEAGFAHPDVVRLASAATSAGVRLLLGTTAMRFRGGRLLTAGPEGIRWIPADRLIYAGGTRPRTLAEMPMAGSRLAGVLPATVAEHLLHAGVRLGRRPVVVGAGHWAKPVITELARVSGRVTWVGTDLPKTPLDGVDAHWAGWRPEAVHGTGRVSALHVSHGAARLRIDCDAVILAGPARPLRNVDGAIREGAPDVLHVQPVDPDATPTRIADLARSIVQQHLEDLR